MNKDPKRTTLILLYFALGVLAAVWLAYSVRNYFIAKAVAIPTAIICYWFGYGRMHTIFFKNTTFNRTVDSIKGFSFFLFFMALFLIVFAKYFIPIFR